MVIEFHGAHLRRQIFPSPDILLFIVSFSKQFGSSTWIFSCLLSIVLEIFKGISALEYSKYSWTSQTAMKPYILSSSGINFPTKWHKHSLSGLDPKPGGHGWFFYLHFHTQATPKPVNTTSLTFLTQTMARQDFIHYQQGFVMINQIRALIWTTGGLPWSAIM